MPVASDKRVRDASFKWLHSNCCNKSRDRQRTFGAYFVFYIHLLASGNLKNMRSLILFPLSNFHRHKINNVIFVNVDKVSSPLVRDSSQARQSSAGRPIVTRVTASHLLVTRDT